MKSRQVERLREAVALNIGARPTFVKIVYVRHIWGHRIDVEFEWVNEPKPCVVHTNARNAREALRQVSDCSAWVRPGRRFNSGLPWLFEPR